MRLRSKVMDLAKPLKQGTATATKKVKSVVSKTKQAVKKSNGDMPALREQVKLERTRVKEARAGVTAGKKVLRDAERLQRLANGPVRTRDQHAPAPVPDRRRKLQQQADAGAV